MEINISLNNLEEVIELSNKIKELNDEFQEALIDFATAPDDIKKNLIKLELELSTRKIYWASELLNQSVIK